MCDITLHANKYRIRAEHAPPYSVFSAKQWGRELFSSILLHDPHELVMPEVQFPQPLVEPVQQNQGKSSTATRSSRSAGSTFRRSNAAVEPASAAGKRWNSRRT